MEEYQLLSTQQPDATKIDFDSAPPKPVDLRQPLQRLWSRATLGEVEHVLADDTALGSEGVVRGAVWSRRPAAGGAGGRGRGRGRSSTLSLPQSQESNSCPRSMHHCTSDARQAASESAEETREGATFPFRADTTVHSDSGCIAALL
eukprot:914193-Rhodomonas_salina.1